MGGVRRIESTGRGNLESGRTVWIVLDCLLTNFEICSHVGLVDGMQCSQNRSGAMHRFQVKLTCHQF